MFSKLITRKQKVKGYYKREKNKIEWLQRNVVALFQKWESTCNHWNTEYKRVVGLWTLWNCCFQISKYWAFKNLSISKYILLQLWINQRSRHSPLLYEMVFVYCKIQVKNTIPSNEHHWNGSSDLTLPWVRVCQIQHGLSVL